MSRNTTRAFRDGDRVVLIGGWSAAPYNPHVESEYGCVGTLTLLDSDDDGFPYAVRWDNDYSNDYREGNLMLEEDYNKSKLSPEVPVYPKLGEVE